MASTLAEVASIVIFLLVIVAVKVFVLIPVHVRIPKTQHKVRISYACMPVVGVVLLLIFQSLSFSGLWEGIKGNANIQPYGILILFLALAYITISIDMAGVFAWLALKLAKASNGSGKLLFFLYFILNSCITAVCSNDITILALTPIICYVALATHVEPVPYLIAEYVSANLFSMALYVGNPTNMIVAQAYDITFLGFLKWMALPSLTCGALGFSLLYLQFKAELGGAYVALPPLEPMTMLSDMWGAVLSCCNLVLCLLLLALAPTLGLVMWQVALVCALVQAAYNLGAYLLLPLWRTHRAQGAGGQVQMCAKAPAARPAPLPASASTPAMSMERAADEGLNQIYEHDTDAEDDSDSTEGAALLTPGPRTNGSVPPTPRFCHTPTGTAQSPPPCPSNQRDSPRRVGRVVPGASRLSWFAMKAPLARPTWFINTGAVTSPSMQNDELMTPASDVMALHHASSFQSDTAGTVQLYNTLQHDQLVAKLTPRVPSFRESWVALPWAALPFTLGMFVMVQGLRVGGWIDRLGSVLGSGCRTTAGAMFLMGAVSTVLGNVMNNQPMTILLTEICLSDAFKGAAGGSSKQVEASLFAVVVGSNIGSCVSMLGALAGMMWQDALARRGVKVSYMQFLKMAGPVSAVLTLAGLGVLCAEFSIA